MPRLNPRLKEFVRQDYSNNDVPGTNIFRKKKPAVGKWREITPINECCFPFTPLTFDFEPDPESIELTVAIYCDDGEVLVMTLPTANATTQEAVDILNNQVGYLGTFSASGDTITLNLNQSVADSLCPDGTVTLEVTN